MPELFSTDPKSLVVLVQVIGAIGALGTAAFGLVDATKALGGGVSLTGLGHLYRCLDHFSGALDKALGYGEWRSLVKAHWLNGRTRAEQKAIIRALIRLGTTPDTASQLATAGHLDRERLVAVAGKLETGAKLTDDDINVLGRLDASIEAHLDAAFDRAEQAYRNLARFVAGGVSVVLSLIGALLLSLEATEPFGVTEYGLAALVGVLAVPLAPVAKDLASSLAAATRAVKAAKG